nr:ribonuclease H-like domain, reverse transcriptase, RNA-dependent DNA polymerase [Tanacetum cinerariifolium]
MGEERVQQARLQTFKSDFEMLHIKEDETINTFTTKLTTLVNKATSLGHNMKDEELVRKLLNAVPDRYLQIVATREQYSDLDEMTLEEAIGRLKTYEERIKTKRNEQSNLVEEDLKPTLLMAILEDEEQHVSLHEEDIGHKDTNKESLWYLDNGASNHMAGVREHFKEIDEKVSGKVKFGDGSYIEIKGKGSIIIECDDEKQRVISHVYYIPDLKSNLLSLENTLKSLDFKKCSLEQAIYTKTSNDSTLLIGVYVDDLIITGAPNKEIDKFQAQMEEKFKMSDLGLLTYYLGIEVTQTNGDILIKQSAYARKILKEAGMLDCNETLIPMDPGTRLTKITERTMPPSAALNFRCLKQGRQEESPSKRAAETTILVTGI